MRNFMWKNILPVVVVSAFMLLFTGCSLFPLDASLDSMDEVRIDDLRAQWYESTRGMPIPDQKGIAGERLEIDYEDNFGMRKHPELPVYEIRRSPELMYEGVPMQDNGIPPVVLNDELVDCNFNFSQAPLVDVLPVFRNALDFNYIIEGNVSGTVTMSLQTKLTRRELWDTFMELLSLSGARASFEAGQVHIYPVGYTSNTLTLNSQTPGMEIGVFQIQNLKVGDVTGKLNNFMGRGLKTIEMPASNMLLVLDTAEELAKVELLIKEMDIPAHQNWHKIVLPCYNVDSDRIVTELSKILPVLGFMVSTTQDKAPEGYIHLQSIGRIQVIIASAATPEALDEVVKWHGVLDENNIGDQEQMFTYDVINSSAEELNTGIAAMFNVAALQLSGSGDGKVTVNTGLGTPSNLPNNEVVAPGTVFEEPVRVFCDSVNNRLIIRTRPRTYAMIKALLEKLDVPPIQVLVEVTVIEVSLTDGIEFGVEFMLQKQLSDEWGQSFGTDYKTLVPNAQQNQQYGGKYYLYNPENPDEKFGYISALASQSNIRMIFNPKIVTINNEQANVQVGDRVPLITSETGNTASGETILRKVEYRETGVQLTVKPRATRGGRILLDISQEISQAQVNTTSNIDSPVIQNRKLTTTMNLRDGQTIICGGIIRDKTVDDLDTLPIINSIPFLRRFLGDTNIQSERTELLILITASIIKESDQMETLLDGYEQSVDSLVEYNNRPRQNVTRQFKHSGSLDSWFFE